MTLKVTAIAPVLNECPWIGFSILSALPYVHEFVYTLDEKSDDGTRELLFHVKDKYAGDKLRILNHPTFHPHDMVAYNEAFNRCIRESTGDAIFFYHPDMLVTRWTDLKEGPLAWWTNITSYAGDFSTVITKGRADKWKNIHANKMGLTYFGAYGSQNEDMYHLEITGKSHRHYGEDFNRYPYDVKDSGISINHYCELKSYKRRLEKMKLCLKTLAPFASDDVIDESAIQHPRVTLEPSSQRFGTFEFQQTTNPIPEVIAKHKDEFEQFTKEKELVTNG